MPTTHLQDRTVVHVEGPDAEHFLQNIVTTDLDQLDKKSAKPGALLTPQGKILFDFLISRSGDQGFRLDVRADVADDFVRRLMLYRLRAKAEISKQDQVLVLARWQDDSARSSGESASSESDSTWLADARFPADARVERGYNEVPAREAPPPLTPPLKGEGGVDVSEPPSPLRGGVRGGRATHSDWTRLRIAHGIAESGSDYALSDAFPHDVLLDETGGVGFRKGCYVGQEVVSRMQHRGTARRRVMLVEGETALPATGADLRANDRSIGTLGSVDGNRGLAIVRIDRVKDALDAGHVIKAGEVTVSLSIPAWAKYTLPQDAASAGDA
jgi:folate-binding protein YgfZ